CLARLEWTIDHHVAPVRMRQVGVQSVARVAMTPGRAQRLAGDPHPGTDDKPLVDGALQGDIGATESGYVTDARKAGLESPARIECRLELVIGHRPGNRLRDRITAIGLHGH